MEYGNGYIRKWLVWAQCNFIRLTVFWNLSLENAQNFIKFWLMSSFGSKLFSQNVEEKATQAIHLPILPIHTQQKTNKFRFYSRWL